MNLTCATNSAINGEYYYVRNAQGDIIGLIDKSGNQVVSYTYDSWGKLISIDGSLKDSVGVKNPYRYRGYRYDTETGLYYVQSRYYNPEWGRFINADALAGNAGELLSHNVFAYCSNNPITRSDPSGFMWRMAEDGISGYTPTNQDIDNEVQNYVSNNKDYPKARWDVENCETKNVVYRASYPQPKINKGIFTTKTTLGVEVIKMTSASWNQHYTIVNYYGSKQSNFGHMSVGNLVSVIGIGVTLSTRIPPLKENKAYNTLAAYGGIGLSIYGIAWDDLHSYQKLKSVWYRDK